MKTNKNIITLASCLAIFTPIICHEPIDKTNKLTGIEETIIIDIAEEVITALESNPKIEQLITATENIINNIISPEEASDLIQVFIEDLTNNHKFTIYNKSFIVDTTRTMSPAEESIASEIIDSAIAAIANAIETAPTATTTHVVTTSISQQAAVILLQQFTNNLVAGNHFELNGTSYIIQN
jgi:hypothetical protein